MKMLRAKSQFLFGLATPNFKLFRSCIPGANNLRVLLRQMFRLKAPGLIIQALAMLHLDAPARLLVWVWKRFVAK